MATNLLILYPQIPFNSDLVAQTADDGTNIYENTINGGRRDHYKLNAAGTTSQLDYDFSYDISPDFYFMARADLLEANDSGNIDVNLIGSASSSFTSPSTISNTLDSSNLVGPNQEDFVALSVNPGAYRYWRLEVNSVASFKHEYSKFWAGNSFDFGLDPFWPRRIIRESSTSADRKVRYLFSFRWSGITNDKRYEFVEKIYKYKDTNSIALASAFYHDVLNEYKVIHCWILDAKWTAKEHSLNDLVLTLEEAT